MAQQEKQINGDTTVFQDQSSEHEVFGNEANHQIQYRTLTWPFVAFMWTGEIVGITTLGFPQAFAVVGLVPGIIVTVFCGIFALYTALLLIDFKLNHPEVHNMGDAGYIIFSPFRLGWLGREVCSAGTLFYAITGIGFAQLSGGLALASLSDHKLCTMLYNGIFAVVIALCSAPRTLDLGMHWLGFAACVSIFAGCIVGMVAAGVEPTSGRQVEATLDQSFNTAFLTITDAVIAYAGHFTFFPIISEMKRPRDAKKAAWLLQICATIFYVLFGVVTYVYLGSTVTYPSLLSLQSGTLVKVAWGLLLPNILMAGAIYTHMAAKIVFVRIFRNSRHLHSHTWLSWSAWIALIVVGSAAGYVLAVGVPIFFFLAGLAAAAFASWFTYGLAGAFWWHDTHHFGHAQAYKYPRKSFVRGWAAVRQHKFGFALVVLTLLAGAFIMVGGLEAIISGIVQTYASGQVGQPFAC